MSRPKLEERDVLDNGGVVYEQRCGDCERVYVGETGRKASTRKKEHEKDVRNLNPRSAIAQHSMENVTDGF